MNSLGNVNVVLSSTKKSKNVQIVQTQMAEPQLVKPTRFTQKFSYLGIIFSVFCISMGVGIIWIMSSMDDADVSTNTSINYTR